MLPGGQAGATILHRYAAFGIDLAGSCIRIFANVDMGPLVLTSAQALDPWVAMAYPMQLPFLRL